MGRLQFGEGILLVQQAATQQVGVEAGGQGPVSGGIFNWQTLAWQKPEGMALAASVALPESESKERSQGEQREKITRPRAVKREEAITVRGETGATGDASGAEGEENLSPASAEFFGPTIASHSCKAVSSALNIPPTPSFLPK